MKIISFLSDFGLSDSYVAEVKAVLLASKAEVMDVTHLVPAHQIEWGAFQLLRAYHHFPDGSWHLAVVDPGVGSDRRAIYAKTRHHHFVGPDNGVLRWAIEDAEERDKKKALVAEIPGEAVSPTFHGRDLFAPFIVRQMKSDQKLKPSKAPLAGRTFPRPRRVAKTWHGEVLVSDHYGNLITSITWKKEGGATAEIRGRKVASCDNYTDIPSGDAALIRGSSGFWEIACRESSAAQRLGVQAGTPLTLVSD